MHISTLLSVTLGVACAVQAHVIGARDGMPTSSLPSVLPILPTSSLPLPADLSMLETVTPANPSVPAMPARRALLPALHAFDLPLALDAEITGVDFLANNEFAYKLADGDNKVKSAKPARRSAVRGRRSLLDAVHNLNNVGPFKHVVGQYRGILSPNTLNAVEAALFPSMLTSTLLHDTVLTAAVQAALDSIAASLSGNSVTAFAELRECVDHTIETRIPFPQCYSTSSGPATALQTALDNIVEQAAGYLAPNIISSITNNIHYHLASLDDKVSLAIGFLPAYKHISNVLDSTAAAAGGNTATAVLQLQGCINNVIMIGVSSIPEGYQCFIDGPPSSLQVILNGVVQQSFGYLPPNLILDLQQIAAPLVGKGNEAAYAQALDTAFRATGAGPRFATCFETLQECMLTAAKSSDKVNCAMKLAAACKAIPETITS